MDCGQLPKEPSNRRWRAWNQGPNLVPAPLKRPILLPLFNADAWVMNCAWIPRFTPDPNTLYNLQAFKTRDWKDVSIAPLKDKTLNFSYLNMLQFWQVTEEEGQDMLPTMKAACPGKGMTQNLACLLKIYAPSKKKTSVCLPLGSNSFTLSWNISAK